MRSPWVSRARFDDLQHVRASDAEYIAQLHAGRKELWARYDDLMAKYHALKLAGAVEPIPLTMAVAKEPDVVTKAIIETAGSNRLLRKQYSEFVTEQRAAGTDEDEIAKAIRLGITDDGGVPA